MESEFIEHLLRRLPTQPALRLGVGDDAAVVTCGGADVVAASDMLVDGRHFRLGEATARQIGRKALAVNLSDFAAMAARPTAALVSFALPEQPAVDRTAGDLAAELIEGMLPLADQFGAAIAGGDTNVWPGPLVVNVALLGTPPAGGVWRRAGAVAGDVLVATGEFGGSLLGRHLDFTPLVDEAAAIAERYCVHAAMDVSDGLSLDASRLAAASGCGVVLDLDRVPIAEAAKLRARDDGTPSLDHALGDGEDFQLLLALAANEAERLLADPPQGLLLTQIGEFAPEPGLFARRNGAVEPLAPQGYVHGEEGA